jgi:hypothetical protein
MIPTTTQSPAFHRDLGTVTKPLSTRADTPVVAARKDRSHAVALPILHGAH